MGKDDIFRKRKEQKTAELERQHKERIKGPRYLIVCEGRKTERFYFKGICDAHRLSTVRVTHSELGPSPSSVVECALKFYESDATQGLDPYDTVYCVIDRDKHTTYDAALRWIEVLRAEGKPFEGIPSIPCFEYWLLLHFTYTRQFFQTKGKKSICDALIRDELRNQDGFADYDKGLKDIYTRLQHKTDTAIKHAKQAEKDASQTGEKNPSTLVHQLVIRLRKLAVGQARPR